jgi:short-subunit dehydrogenase
MNGIALITGGGTGIGREMAVILGAQGHPLVLVGRNAARLEETADEIRVRHRVEVWTFASDLAKPGAAHEVYRQTCNAGIEVELLVNNAGVGIYGEHTQLDRAEVDSMLRLNITSLTDLCLLYGADMKRRGHGRILNIASTAAYQPTPFFAAYGASKAYVLNFSEALAMEMRDHGVTVSVLSPGPTDTGFFSAFDASGVSNAHLAARDSARSVAERGVSAMMRGKLSTIVGWMNFLRAWSARFATRKMVARIAHAFMRSKPLQLPASVR